MQNTSIITIFLTGLLTGGLSCLAVQGGLLAATIAEREKERAQEKTTKGAARPILAFLTAKLIAYTILGGVLGALGSLFDFSLTLKIFLQVLIGVFMIGTALNLLNVHRYFRYFAIQPPKFLTRLIKNQSKSRDVFAPALLGAFTIFIPCGITLAAMALATASGKALTGAATMFAFTLGTSPTFFVLGYTATRLGDAYQRVFLKVAAYAIIILAIFNLNNTAALAGSSWTLNRLAQGAFCQIAYCKSDAPGLAVSEATIQIQNYGYTPDQLTVPAGAKVILHLVNANATTCAQEFVIPKLGIKKLVPLNQNADISFIAPKQKGQMAFMCGMGMFRGVINVD